MHPYHSPRNSYIKLFHGLPPLFSLTTLEDIESKKTRSATYHGRCVSASFSKITSHMRMRCSPVAEVIQTATRLSKHCGYWRYVSVWESDVYVPWSKSFGRHVQSLPREICYYMNLWRQFHILFPGTLWLHLLEPQRRERNEFIASRASNLLTLETWWPCNSYPGRNRILALISRYQNQPRLRDHAQTFGSGTSGSEVYINISLTMTLSLYLRLTKMKYWKQSQNHLMIARGRCAPFFSKLTALVKWKCFVLPKIQHNVRMFLWERSFVKLWALIEFKLHWNRQRQWYLHVWNKQAYSSTYVNGTPSRYCASRKTQTMVASLQEAS
jgi:hypothetical protein